MNKPISFQKSALIHHIKKILICSFLLIIMDVQAQSSLYDDFVHPPEQALPWTFWYWMQGAVSKLGIKADLEAMKKIGLGGAYLFFIKGTEKSVYPNSVAQLTPEWWDMVKYSFHVADSLQLKLGLHISDGFALAGGPWIKPEESMQKLVFTDTIVKSGKRQELTLRQPETNLNYYQDIAIYAFPVTKILKKDVSSQLIQISSDNPDDKQPFSTPGKDFRSENPCSITYQYDKPFTLRSLEITPSGNNVQSQRFVVEASNNGVHYRTIKALTPPRQGWQNYGFTTTFSIPETKATYFKLSWTPVGTEPGSEDMDAGKWRAVLKVKKIVLSTMPKLESWEGKSGLVWRIASTTTENDISDKKCIPLKKIIVIKPEFIDGKIHLKLPRGEWVLLRMGHTSTGMTNATGGAAKGLECDKFTASAVQKQFDNWFGAAFKNTDEETARRVLKYLHIDSWECGSQNWSPTFASEFEQRRGYNLLKWLPVMAGYPIENTSQSEKVLLDVRQTIAELVNDVFFKTMTKKASDYDCSTSAECVAPTMVSDGLRHYKEIDYPMGEFWLRSPTHDKPNDMLDAISGAHIYGKNIIQAEGCTQLRTVWNEDPALIKPLIDRNFALGMNKYFFHVYVHNPYLDKAPGNTLDGIGLYFQRDQTWWNQSGALVDYLKRCQALLQYGKPVTDIAVFTGENIPSRALTPNKLVDILPGIIGAERVQMEKERLLNTNQPLMEMPAGVTCSANIYDPQKWINPLQGYAYDSFTKDVLDASTIENGKLTLASGVVYKIVIFPLSASYSPATKRKIDELRAGGVTVITERVDSTNFHYLGVDQDVVAPKNIAWTHRTGEMGDVYFISNQENSERKIQLSFRNTQSKPSVWNPINVEISTIENFTRTTNTTTLEITLAPYASTFVVFSFKNYAITKNAWIFNDTISVTNKWDVRFNKNQVVKQKTELFDWSIDSNPLVKYYSGSATYSTTFNFKYDLIKQFDTYTRPVYLSLGRVANLATVRINGVDCGTAWTPPYELDITKALKKGLNKLEIEVTNTWANAIKGSDIGTPAFQGIWTDGKYRIKDNELMESGLIGPVLILQKK